MNCPYSSLCYDFETDRYECTGAWDGCPFYEDYKKYDVEEVDEKGLVRIITLPQRLNDNKKDD